MIAGWTVAGDPHLKPEPRKKAPKRLRRSHGNTVPPDTLTALQRRSGGLCEVRAPGCWGRAEHPHHRRLKAHGVDHSLDGLLAVCVSCHSHVHHHVAESYARGWLVRTEADAS